MIASNCSREQGRATCWRTTDVSRAAACVNRGFSLRYLLDRRDTAVLAALPRFPPSYHRDVLRTTAHGLTLHSRAPITQLSRKIPTGFRNYQYKIWYAAETGPLDLGRQHDAADHIVDPQGCRLSRPAQARTPPVPGIRLFRSQFTRKLSYNRAVRGPVAQLGERRV